MYETVKGDCVHSVSHSKLIAQRCEWHQRSYAQKGRFSPSYLTIFTNNESVRAYTLQLTLQFMEPASLHGNFIFFYDLDVYLCMWLDLKWMTRWKPSRGFGKQNLTFC